jgi:uncharacterized protein (TIGR03000 family)
MFQNGVKVGLIVVALGFVVEDAKALGHCGMYGYANGYGYGTGCGGWKGRPIYGLYGPGGLGCPVWYGYGSAIGSYGCSCTQCASYFGPACSSFAHNSPLTPDSLQLSIDVPADATVIVNGKVTTSTGEHRLFETNGILPNAAYQYQVQVEYIRDGQPVREEKTIAMTGGQAATLSFNAVNAEPETQVADKATSSQR